MFYSNLLYVIWHCIKCLENYYYYHHAREDAEKISVTKAMATKRQELGT